MSRTYAKAGTYGVGVRYVDDGHETSPVTRHDLVVTDAASGGGAPGGGDATTGAGGADRIARRPALRSSKVMVKGRVATLRVRLDEAVSGTATLRRGTATLGKATIKAPAKGDATIKVTLARAAAAKVRRGRPLAATLTLAVRDAAGNARTLRKAITLRR